MEDRLWGDKKRFAIELGNNIPNPKRGKLRFWINGEPFGEFKVTHKLIYAIESLRTLFIRNEIGFEELFEKMSLQEIFSYCLFLNRNSEDFAAEDYILFEKLRKYSLFFGDQFDSTAHVIYVKENDVYFLWSTNNDYSGRPIDYLKKLIHTTVAFKDVQEVCTEFIRDVEV